MALSRSRRRPPAIDYWPGFVDALSTLLLVITFLMVLFMVAQYFAQSDVSRLDLQLANLQKKLSLLADQLSMEKAKSKSAVDEASSLRATLAASESEKKKLAAQLSAEGTKGGSAEARISSLTKQLDDQRAISAQAAAQVELLLQQLAALKKQISVLQDSLG